MGTNESPALHFVRHLYRNGQESTGHSWVRLNGALRHSVKVAIEGGLTFGVGDFDTFHETMKAYHWLSNADGMYRTAVEYGNISACLSYEKMHGFAPYMLEGQRVYVGRDFYWEGKYVTCTSIAKEFLIACSYKPDPKGYRSSNIEKRYTIDHASLATEDKRLNKLAADKKMAKANSLAEEWFRGNRHTEAQRKLSLTDDLIGKLEDYQKERVLGIIKKRFKNVRPSMVAFVAMGFRFQDDQRVVVDNASRMMWDH